ncbi:hypothetical protein [Nocardia lijiangensis]|uniref:hypothetical protein n=1 Tax=Nocardia lijiangensis TaxID=299618 RepID=UPI0012DC53C3|nr:hypothetical protein [Nocardia lijiangensis]
MTALADTASAKASPGWLAHRRHARLAPSVTRRKLTRAASAAALSACGVVLAFALPADGAVAALAPFGLR